LLKLKTRAQFEAALKSEVVARSEHFVLHCLRTRPRVGPGEAPLIHVPSAARQAPSPHDQSAMAWPSGPAFGVLVPKRWAARAVTRNMIKRQAREIAQESLDHEQGRALFLLRLRRAWPPQQFTAASSPAWVAEVRQQLLKIFSSLETRPS